MAHSEDAAREGQLDALRASGVGWDGYRVDCGHRRIAADRLGRWDVWLDDPQQIEAAFYHLSIAARKRGARVAELLRPRVGVSDEWNNRLRWMILPELNSELVDLTVEAIDAGLFDGAERFIVHGRQGSDFWMSGDFWDTLYGFKLSDPAGAARLVGAFFRRALVCARRDGRSDPFTSGYLGSSSTATSVVDDVARSAPAEFVENVLPFVIDVAMADQYHTDGELPGCSAWMLRGVPPNYTMDNTVFSAVDEAVRAFAVQHPAACATAVVPLRDADSAELRFFACRALTVIDDPDDAVGWMVSDPRNLALGWSNSRNWASRELIGACSPGCSDDLFEQLESALLDYRENPSRHRQNYGQYELLTALDVTRMSALAKRRLRELESRFPDMPPQDPQPRVTGSSGVIGPPIDADTLELMSDDDWIDALKQHTTDDLNRKGDTLVGGMFELAQELGRRAQADPERFTELALRFDESIPHHAMNAVISSVADSAGADDSLAELCEHGRSIYGLAVGRTVCRAVSRVGAANTRLVELLGVYAHDADSTRGSSRIALSSPDEALLEAGMNSTRGQAALAAASVLFATADHLAALLPVVDALARDETLAVRACAAEAVVALLNHRSEHALDLAEHMFAADIGVLDAATSERLLTDAVLRDPERFAGVLTAIIATGERISTRAGRVWAIAHRRDRLPAEVDADVRALPTAARRGAVGVFLDDIAGSVNDLRRVVNDEDPDIQHKVGIVMLKLDEVPVSARDDLITAFAASAAFPKNRRNFFTALAHDGMPVGLTASMITACERAVEITAAEFADGSKVTTLEERSMMTTVLRLYRQGDRHTRTRCLDIVDKLVEFGVDGLSDTRDEKR